MKKVLILMLLVLFLAAGTHAETMKLPASLSIVESEAFTNVSADGLKLSEGASRIESRAFAGSGIKWAVLPASLTYIAEDAFENSSLICVDAPKGSYAYNWAARKGFLDSASVASESDFEYLILFGKCEVIKYTGKDVTVRVPSFIEGTPVTSIGEGAFAFSAVQSIVLPGILTSIRHSAFEGCDKLMNINLPESLDYIGESAFEGCTGLKSIAISNYAYIDIAAFKDCRSLTNITLSDSIKYIEYSAFENCISIKSITLPHSLCTVSNSMFYGCESLTSITIPNSASRIGDSAFSCCKNLTSISIPNSVTYIGNYAFSGCGVLETISIPESVTNIGSNAFANCSKLRSISIPNSVSNINWCTFDNCINLENVKLPASVTQIGSRAFENCASLSYITLPNTVETIGDAAFSNCSSLTEVLLPDGVTSIGWSVFSGCRNLKHVSLPKCISDITGFFSGCCSLSDIAIPDAVSVIGACTFSGCSSLTIIIVPKTVTSIDWAAFSGCRNLEKISLPASISSIDTEAFVECDKLKTVIAIKDSFAWRWAVEHGYEVIAMEEGSKIDLNFGAATLTVGSTLQLNATTYPENGIELRVVWSSEDNRVAIVDESGLVTALSVGMCKIVATKEENSAVFSYCVITVTDDNQLEAFEQFGNRCMELEKNYEGYRSDALDYPDFGIGRLMVETTDSLPDISGFNPEIILQDGDSFFIIQFLSAREAYDCAEYLESCKVIKAVEPDQYVEVRASSFSSQNTQPEYLGWGISAIHADEYQKDLIRRGRTGSVIVAVMDTGLSTNHVLFNGRIYGAKDYVKTKGSISDEDGHGTHVAGIIAGCTQDLNVKIMPIRIIEHTNDTIPKMRIRNAFEYIFKMKANIINISLEVEVQKSINIFGHEINCTTPQHNAFDKYIKIACQDKEISVIVAAGNSATDTSNICPAHLSECITVSAIERSGKLWSN